MLAQSPGGTPGGAPAKLEMFQTKCEKPSYQNVPNIRIYIYIIQYIRTYMYI